MFVDLISMLRCVRAHEESWLVAAAYRTTGRHIVEGALGCPVCHAEYPVAAGIADFAGGAARAAPAPDPSDPRETDEDAMRAAALLHLIDVRAPVLLAGRWGTLGERLADLAPASYLVLDPVRPPAVREELSALRATGTVPVAAGALHAVALDAATARDPGTVAGAVRTLRARGRLVAPAWLPLPAECTELARDVRHWVAERDAPPSAPVRLELGRR
ncbi:MAG TPA: hypothetical protein VFY16_04020 [Gemmatimonadaceae bacterium]|nr:hypothetical protein [Gemmatimonadaceae bacterium]